MNTSPPRHHPKHDVRNDGVATGLRVSRLLISRNGRQRSLPLRNHGSNWLINVAGAIARRTIAFPILALWLFGLLTLHAAEKSTAAVHVAGEIVDADTGHLLPARIYIEGSDGVWHFPAFAAAAGSAIRYERQRPNTQSLERHTTLSADPFRVELPAGRYTFTVARGKEYLPEARQVMVAANMPKLSFSLRRWVNMAQSGWYSGDTHVHRAPAELANLMLAEDLNVA